MTVTCQGQSITSLHTGRQNSVEGEVKIACGCSAHRGARLKGDGGPEGQEGHHEARVVADPRAKYGRRVGHLRAYAATCLKPLQCNILSACASRTPPSRHTLSASPFCRAQEFLRPASYRMALPKSLTGADLRLVRGFRQSGAEGARRRLVHTVMLCSSRTAPLLTWTASTMLAMSSTTRSEPAQLSTRSIRLQPWQMQSMGCCNLPQKAMPLYAGPGGPSSPRRQCQDLRLA